MSNLKTAIVKQPTVEDHTSRSVVARPSSAEVDTSILDYNLSLSVEERIRNHERSRHLAIELRHAGEKAYGERES